MTLKYAREKMMDFIEIESRETHVNFAMSELQGHNYYELYFLLKGTRNLFFENKMITVSENSLCIIPPFCMHKTEGGPYKRVNINISPDLLTHNEKTFLDECAEDVAYKIPPNILNIVISLLNEATEVEIVNTLERKNMLLSFTKIILHFFKKEQLQFTALKASELKTTKDTLILKIISYVNEHFSENFTLDDLCKKFFISKNTLCQRFQNSMHCSIVQYRLFARINMAKKLLTTTTKSIEEISEYCGFSSANYFSLIFKKEVGLSPINYKKTK